MKTLSLEKMENIQGGDYCTIISYWFYSGGDGFQGDYAYVAWLFAEHCFTPCPL